MFQSQFQGYYFSTNDIIKLNLTIKAVPLTRYSTALLFFVKNRFLLAIDREQKSFLDYHRKNEKNTFTHMQTFLKGQPTTISEELLC